MVSNMNFRQYKLFINGKWCDGKNDGEFIERRNPSSGNVVAKYINGSNFDIDYASEIALGTLKSGAWSELSREKKSSILLKVANGIESRIEELSIVESLETGKSINDARSDINNGIKYWEYAASIVRVEYGEFINNIGSNKGAYTIYDPVGVVAIILPWNFPFIVLSERLPFILAAGCSVVAKPSEYASGTCLILGEILKDAGMANGVYNVITGHGSSIGNYLVSNKNIAMVSFTGSTQNGKSVMKTASNTLKKVSLELGGKSPIIVFSDCDLDKAVDAVINGFTDNAGQCCIATSRLLVDDGIYGKLKEKIIRKLNEIDFQQSLATDDQFNKVKSYIDRAKEISGLDIVGGEIDEKKLFISPTIVEYHDTNYEIYKEEIFGPVLAVTVFKTEEEAIQLANNTEYGLAASIWTSNMAKANRIVRKINAGRFWINSQQVNYPELPVGGLGISGIGREAGSQGILIYSEIKSVIYGEK